MSHLTLSYQIANQLTEYWSKHFDQKIITSQLPVQKDQVVWRIHATTKLADQPIYFEATITESIAREQVASVLINAAIPEKIPANMDIALLARLSQLFCDYCYPINLLMDISTYQMILNYSVMMGCDRHADLNQSLYLIQRLLPDMTAYVKKICYGEKTSESEIKIFLNGLAKELQGAVVDAY